VAPTEHLVVGGLYRHIRNPMYLAVVASIVGQALVLGQVVLVAWATVVGVVVAGFAHWFEGPSPLRKFGAEYEAYRNAVPPWWPGRHAWRPGEHGGADRRALTARGSRGTVVP
jgi:protein-S-isoprenylcysteine O-methyltransferase Ste14